MNPLEVLMVHVVLVLPGDFAFVSCCVWKQEDVIVLVAIVVFTHAAIAARKPTW